MSDHAPLVIYDDAVTVPPDITAVTGVKRFGDVLRRRERLATTVRELAEAAELDGPLHLRDVDDRRDAEERLRRRPDEALVLLLPAHLAPTANRENAVLFLRKLRYVSRPVALDGPDGLTGACLVERDAAIGYLAEAQLSDSDGARYLERHAATLPPVEDALGLADLTRLAVALEFLSGSFSARHFNHIAQDRYHVVKRSSDREKIRREYRFFSLLPEEAQPFFLQPYDFQEDDSGASYRLRRLFVPDLAVQWVHRALSGPEFEQLLGHLFNFVATRPSRSVDAPAARGIAQELFVDKVETRIDQLLDLEDGRRVDETLEAGGLPGGVRGLYARYRRVLEDREAKRPFGELRVTHGDPAFSNILYSPSTQTMALIDPRGADTEDEIYSDPYYDVAKLSHSILGGYDYIVAGLFELVHDDRLGLRLRFDEPPPVELQTPFVDVLAQHDFDPALVRTYEASLFLSMLPLHIDVPKRVTAFALRARDILEELER